MSDRINMTAQAITWQGALDWTRATYQRRADIYGRSRELAAAQARAAHPDTNGEPLLVHNWGNAAAKRAWKRHDARTNRISTILDAAYSAVWAAARATL